MQTAATFSADRFQPPTDEPEEVAPDAITVEQVIEQADLVSYRRLVASRPGPEQGVAVQRYDDADAALVRLVREYGLQCYRAGLADMDGVS